MDFGAGLREVVGIPFSQQHRAFDSLGLGQLRRFFFGELTGSDRCRRSLGHGCRDLSGRPGISAGPDADVAADAATLRAFGGVGRGTPFNA